MSIPLPKPVAVTLALTLVCGGTARAGDAVPPSDRKLAAAAFDQGVALFQHAEYAAAAQAFLEADRRSPSATAILNAIGAAKRAGDHLLVAHTAERAIARGDAIVEARAALAEAATRLARLELGCESAPCVLRLDGEEAPAASYVLPGTHRVEARGQGDATAEERVVCAAGATYRISLRPRALARPDTPPPARKGLPPGVFFGGLSVTAVLAGVTVWSGVDAISAKHALPAVPAQSQEDDVLARARRTDYLLLGAGIAGVASAAIGAFLTEWRPRAPADAAPATAAVVPLPGGASLVAGGRF